MLVPRIGSLRCFKLMKSAVWGPRPALVRIFCHSTQIRAKGIAYHIRSMDDYLTQDCLATIAISPSTCSLSVTIVFVSPESFIYFNHYFVVHLRFSALLLRDIILPCKSTFFSFFFFLLSLPSIFSFFLFVLFSFPFDSIEALLSGLCHNKLSQILDIPEKKHIFFQI